MTNYSMTQHAQVRANQRGVPHALIDALIRYSDVETPVGNGYTALRLSRRQLADRDLRCSLGANLDRQAGLAIVCAGDTGEVVTVLHDHGRPNGRRYRRSV